MIRAIFGGTFDPIHNGHLQTAAALVKELGISTLALMPSAVPPHRPQPDASPEQRLDMVNLASQYHKAFTVEDWELRQDRPSFTANTLSEFKTQFPDDTLLFVMGMDSLMSLHHWHHWCQSAKCLAYKVESASGPMRIAKSAPEVMRSIGSSVICS